ncbi:MAG: ClpXP protease specificity-enhancing factor SspB [Wolbachia pipientis]|nr:ClpXP protease specificity-enhancing factor SspB [Wolbachia pipientis]
MDKIDCNKSLNLAKFQVIKKALDTILNNDFTPHLEILFSTCSNGVIVPNYLKKSYPTQMLIILQHQFYGLKVFEDKFSVELYFHGKQEQITVSFFAISKFYNKTSGDILIFDKINIDSNKKYIKKLLNGNIISIDQLRNK